eukprot:TRINITY_DN3556_c0_g1_i1.p1 TRINITY_DN3556_c0_g1~~TRINITY_DN3556_c0_g1_i1.p1  ORF type:complete len:510 (-),score=88.62 TRINITY_DN3556_c0_g1_i1:319-1719(-)
MPGLIDPHAHLNVPGTDSEGVGSGTAAAAAGGTTTLLDMPLNSVPSTISLPTLRAKVDAFVADPPTVDVGFIGGAVGDGGGQTPTDVAALVVAGGVFALKSFLVDSQSPNFPHVSLPQMRAVMEGLAALGNRSVPYILHAELPPNVSPSGAEGAEGSIGQDYPGDGTSLVDWAASRPHSWEVDAVRAVVTAAAVARVPAVHVAHVASAEAAAVVAEAAAAAAALSAVAAVGGHGAGWRPASLPKRAHTTCCGQRKRWTPPPPPTARRPPRRGRCGSARRPFGMRPIGRRSGGRSSPRRALAGWPWSAAITRLPTTRLGGWRLATCAARGGALRASSTACTAPGGRPLRRGASTCRHSRTGCRAPPQTRLGWPQPKAASPPAPTQTWLCGTQTRPQTSGQGRAATATWRHLTMPTGGRGGASPPHLYAARLSFGRQWRVRGMALQPPWRCRLCKVRDAYCDGCPTGG